MLQSSTRARRASRHALAALVLAASAAGAARVARAQQPARTDADSEPKTIVHGVDISALSYRFIGPQGNRVSAVTGEPGNPDVAYIGAASGGIWKTTDGGIHWQPVFDRMDAQSIGALAVAPSDHSIVWAGTGEPFIRSNVSVGDGIYRSLDAGRTWTHMGLEKTGRIARIVIDPHDPNIVFACALGHGYGPQPERGVYRTTDGGVHWEHVLFVNDSTGCSDLGASPLSPHVLYAGMWQFVIHTWGKYSGGKGSGVYVSRDGGTTWHRITGHGLPSTPVGKVAVAVAPSNPDRVYALMETGGHGALWRSDDDGKSWKTVSYSHLLAERPHYYTRMLVSPSNDLEVYFPSNVMMVTRDGGETVEELHWGGDNHDMWADPTNADRMMLGFDGGAMLTTTHGRGWNHVILPIAQIYHVAVDDLIPYHVYGNEQDYSSVRGPSNTREGGMIPSGAWQTVAGCETGFTYPDPVDPNIVWGNCYAGGVERYDLRTGQTRTVDPSADEELDAPADSVKYRWNWTMPLALSPHDHDVVYVGSQYVHMTKDGGQTWQIISPDLTLNDTTRMGPSGGLTLDNLGVEYGSTLFAIAESPVAAGEIWTGSNDGQVYLTRDGGAHWTNVTRNIPKLPPWGTISNIEPSRYDAGTAYISVDFHQVNDRDPYIYRTSDYGQHWTFIAGGIPKSVFSYVHVVREDPLRRGMLYAGTENAIYVSLDDGAHWEPLQTNLPHAPVTWLTIQKHFDDLVVATSGRGFYILDDIAPLRDIDRITASTQHYLFAPRAAYRFRTVNRVKTDPNDQSAGRNPPYGADLTYFLRTALDDHGAPGAGAAGGKRRQAPKPTRAQAEAAARAGANAPGAHDTLPAGADSAARDSTKRQRDSLRIVIRDAQGKIVRRMTGPSKAGVNRAWWDLRYDKTDAVELRTTPAGQPHIWEEKRFVGKRTRPIYHYGIEEPKLGPLVAPGRYTVELIVAHDTLRQPLTVLRDPHSAGSDADIMAGTRFSVELRDDIDTVVHAINRIERVRKQLEDLRDMYGKDSTMKATLAKAKALDSTLSRVEARFLQPVLQEDDPKTYRQPMRLYTKLLFLAGMAGTGAGDVAGNPDFSPTQPEIAQHEALHREMESALAELHDVMSRDVVAFNQAVGAGPGGVVGR